MQTATVHYIHIPLLLLLLLCGTPPSTLCGSPVCCIYVANVVNTARGKSSRVGRSVLTVAAPTRVQSSWSWSVLQLAVRLTASVRQQHGRVR